MKRSLTGLGFLAAAGWLDVNGAAPAPGPPQAGRDLASYFQTETERLAGACLAEIHGAEDWTARKDIYRRQLFEMLSLWPVPESTPLRAAVTGTLEHELFTVEKLHFQSMPGFYATANLYLPKAPVDPVPAILYLCGHGPVVKDGVSYGNKVTYQHHGAWFARHGYACLILDSVQMGEIQGIHHGTYREGMWWWNARGYSSAGAEAWNCIRALDYLSTRKEIDAHRIGVTGRSGGGAYSWWIAALDDRVQAAAPVAGMTDLENHVVGGAVEGHCDCMFMVNTRRWDYPQVAALVAPRPLLIVNTDADTIFPLDGVVRTHARVRRIYELLGAKDKLGLVIGPGPHKDTQDLQVPVFRWFNKHLKGEDPPIVAAAEKFFQPEQLKVFDRLPADERTSHIEDSFVPMARPPPVPENVAAWAGQRDAWMGALKEQCFAGWPEREGALDLRRAYSAERHGVRLEAWDFTSQPGVRLRLYRLGQAQAKLSGPPVLDVLHDPELDRLLKTKIDGEAAAQSSRGAGPVESPRDVRGPMSAPQWLAIMRAGFEAELAVELESVGRSAAAPDADGFARLTAALKDPPGRDWFVLAPRGLGLTAWDPKLKSQTHIRRRFMLLGQTLEGMRVWDVAQAIRALRAVEPSALPGLAVRGRGSAACNVLYASLFAPGVVEAGLWDLPSTHMEGPDYLNVLRFLDVPQAAAMAAERVNVRLHGVSAGAWSYPEAVADKLHWKIGRFSIDSGSGQ